MARSMSRRYLQMSGLQPKLGVSEEPQRAAVVGQSPENPIDPAHSTHRITGSGIISMLVPITGTTNDPVDTGASAGVASQQSPEAAAEPITPNTPTTPAAGTASENATERAAEAIRRRKAKYGITV